MSRKLRSLKGLEAFEAAARHLSFAHAAAELGVTPAAVSQRVRALEQTLDLKLFVRHARAVELTAVGQSALDALSTGFDHLEKGYRQLSGAGASNRVVVSTNPSFAARWVIPRLHRFQEAHPDISVRLDTTSDLVDFRAQAVDLAIRQGRGRYPDLHSQLLLRDHALVVCHPRLQAGLGRDQNSEWSGKLPLLHVDWDMETEAAPTWRRWCEFNGIERLDTNDGIRFSMEDLAVRAALAGLGYALVTHVFVSDELAKGQLVPATPRAMDMPTVFQHYVVHPQGDDRLPAAVKAFKDWLLGEAGAI